MSAAMQRMVTDAGLRERLSAAGRATAERYSWPVVRDAYTALYRELIDRAASRVQR
jgi:glycosyltransferase involved in cell wall biosynthesis